MPDHKTHRAPRVLIACEQWGRVRDACIALGLDAISCDLENSRTPGPHLKGDICDYIGKRWDALIAFPECERLCNSGVRWLHERPENWPKMRAAAEFFVGLDRANHIKLRRIENPVMHGHARRHINLRKADQTVQPHFFGDAFKKRTCFWTTGLPPLVRTHRWPDDYPPGTELVEEVWRMPPGPERKSLRGRTYPGIAQAIAINLHRELTNGGTR